MVTIAAFIFVLGILIFIHELGHFLVAKKAGIRVDKFSLGFPPNIFSRKIGETTYCIGIIPLGGYVKMAGDNPLEQSAGAP
ncbi:MAG: site-2 protease family protein, partial [candidate division Zixibacteria bacterium]|nr:site-2 protease family protein [candidate division Zixibacteria bacterium]